MRDASIGKATRGSIVLLSLLVVVALFAVPVPAMGNLDVVTHDSGLQEAGWGDATSLAAYNPMEYPGSMYRVAQRVGADDVWAMGFTGQGVDIALIDSGVVPVDGLTASGKVINGPDLSFDSQVDNLRHLDTYGHGTHMAGIIAGRDDAVTAIDRPQAADHFVGIAPNARIVNVKVADAQGATDVSQVIAAIDWVVQHRNDNGLNIRVINLSYGTDSTQDYLLDPLAYAVEQAWKAGIVVVVAAGNDGNGSLLRNPATDPFVIAVGASRGTKMKGGKESPIAPFSSCGTAARHVDVLAPGESVVSLRNPGSDADQNHPEAVVVDRLFLGSGTSQAAAVTSGAVALLLEQRPELTPDQVKALLTETAETTRQLDPICAGAGEIDVNLAAWADTPSAQQTFTASRGTGSLEAARGSNHVEHDGVALEGEQDIFGNDWDGVSWSTAAAQGVSWSGGDWNGVSWSGVSWSGVSWSGVTWSGVSWSGVSWSGVSWSNNHWNGVSWSGVSWSNNYWNGVSWSGNAWLGVSWD